MRLVMASRIPLLTRDFTHRRIGIAVVQRFAFLPQRAPRSAEDRRRLADAARSMREHTKLFSISLSCISLRSSAISAVKMLLTSPSERTAPAFHSSPGATPATAARASVTRASVSCRPCGPLGIARSLFSGTFGERRTPAAYHAAITRRLVRRYVRPTVSARGMR
jgi:hypothetical protein